MFSNQRSFRTSRVKGAAFIVIAIALLTTVTAFGAKASHFAFIDSATEFLGLQNTVMPILSAAPAKPAAATRSEAALAPAGVTISVALPAVTATPGDITVPVTVGDMTGAGIFSYDLQITFDPAVVQPTDLGAPGPDGTDGFDVTGTLSATVNMTSGVTNAGHLVISGFSAAALSGGPGTLINLKFTVQNNLGASTNLTFENYTDPGSLVHPNRFNEGAPGISTTNGSVTIPAATATNTATATFTPTPLGPCGTGSPIEVQGTILGTTLTGYPTLKAGFDAINAGTHTGAPTINVCGNTTEAASAVLNADASGSAAYSSIAMAPVGGPWTISGSIAGALVDLNGADNVTITGSSNLTFDNTLSGATPSTIRLIGDASNNTVQTCTIKGAGTSATLGTVFFSTGTATGNDGNTITGNNINSSGANFATNGIYSAGTSAAVDNSGNIVTFNNISDYFNAAAATAGINLSGTGNSGWTISSNRLFQTANRVYTSSNTHLGINVGVGSGYTINSNTIGFADSSGTGTTNMVGNSVALTGTFPSAYTLTGTANATRYIGISAAFTAGGAASDIQNNTIAGFAIFTSSGAATTNGIWCGINVTSGNVNIGTTSGNTIGSTSGVGSVYAATTTTGGQVVGIFATSANTVNIQNNSIGGLDASGTTAAKSGGITAIDAAGAGNFTINSNTIGNTTADNMRAGYMLSGANLSNAGTLTSTTGGTSQMNGVRSSATGTSITMNGNTLRGWANGGTAIPVQGLLSNGAMVTNNSLAINNNFLGTSGLGWVRYAFANTSPLAGIQATGSPVAPSSVSIQNNDFRGIVYSVTGASANTYILNSVAAASTNIIGNTFTNLNIASTSGVTFITNAVTHVPNTVQNVNSNSVVSSFTSSSTGQVNFYSAGGSSGNKVIETNDSNNFSNMTFTTGATINGWTSTNGATPGSRKTVTNNTFSNITNGGATATKILEVGTGDFYYDSNNVNGNTINGIVGGGNVTGITSTAFDGNQNFFSNTISAMSSSGASATVTGILITGGTIQNIRDNVVSNLSASGGTSPVVNGINVANGAVLPEGSYNVFRNKIYDLSQSGAISTTSPAINGLLCSGNSGNANVTVYNNLIGDLRAPAANLTDAIRGLSVTATGAPAFFKVYYNTVRLAASSTGTNFGTTGFFHAASAIGTTGSLTFSNNAIINNSVPAGTGLTVAYRRSVGTAGTLLNYASASNNNSFYAGTPGAARLIYSDGTSSAQTIGQYRDGVFTAGTIASRDSVSTTDNPTFLSLAGANANFLHPDPTVATALESGAANVGGITSGFDGNIRQGNPGYGGAGTAPDIGAVEFAGIALDVVAPTINYATLGKSTSLTTRAFNNVTITDASGVNGTLGTRPRVYYRDTTSDASNTFNDNTSATAGWKYAEANGSTSPFDFTIDLTLLNVAPVVGDTIAYFVVAQDSSGTPNVAINSGSFAATPTSVALTAAAFPIGGTINSYTIIAGTAYTGSYNVGPTETITTLTGAGGLFSLINAGVVTGNITVNITGDITTETGANALNAWAETSGGNFTMTIQPTGAARTVSGAAASAALIKLNGANRVTINGSIDGLSTDRSLTITNTSVTTPSVIQIGSVGTTPVVNDVVKNCVVINGDNSGSAVVVGDAGTLGSAGYFNNITVQNNDVQRALRGVFYVGVQLGTNGSGTLITENTMNTAGANSIRLNPISIQGVNGATISNNTVGNILDALAESPIGIRVFSGCDNVTVSGNTVSNITLTNTGGVAIQGISFAAGPAVTTSSVTGNTVSNLTSAGGVAAFIGITVLSPNTNITNNNVSGISNSGAATYVGINCSGVRNAAVSGNTVTAMSSTVGVPIGLLISAAGANVNVSGNNISNLSTSAAASGTVGISIASSLDGITIQKNRVTGIFNSSTSSVGATGIRVNGGSKHIIQNNFVSDIKMDMSAGGGLFSTTTGVQGIVITQGASHKVYNNSVNLFGLLPGTPASGIMTSAFAINATSCVNCDVRNNIFANTISGGTTSIAHVAVYLASGGNSAMNLIMDRNSLYYGTDVTQQGAGQAGTTPGTNFFTTLPLLKAYSSTLSAGGTNDSTSISSVGAVPYTTSTNLHLLTGSAEQNTGVTIASVTDDIDGDARPLESAYEIGADEVPPPATPTNTATPSSTATATNTPTPPAIVSGTVTYGNANGSPSIRTVPGVAVNAAGSVPQSDTTTAAGTYSLTNFGSGAYTITPSKSGGQNGSITAFDAARIAQHMVGNLPLTTIQRTVADVSGNGEISSYDASLIGRYSAGLGAPTGSTGTWLFDPANYIHASITTDLTDNFSALIMGEVSGNWDDPTPHRANFGPERNTFVEAPHQIAAPGSELMIPITVQGAANKEIISYEFDLRYDPKVIQPLDNTAVLKNTVSRGLTVVVNAKEPGLLRVVVYGPTPIDQDGVLLKLRFTAVGQVGALTTLTFERMMFNEGDPSTTVTDGEIELSYAISN